jgi:hypothetical protein
MRALSCDSAGDWGAAIEWYGRAAAGLSQQAQTVDGAARAKYLAKSAEYAARGHHLRSQ